MDVIVVEAVGRLFAMPFEAVAAILEPVPIAPVPFMPAYIEGLASLRGRITLVASLAARLGGKSATGGKLVLVSDRFGGGTAMRVDAVRSLLRGSAPEPPGEEEAGLRSELLTGVIVEDCARIPVLNAAALVEGAENGAFGGGVSATAGIRAGGGTVELWEEASAERALALRVGGRDYALLIDEVTEVLMLPEIAPVPDAPAGVLGVAPMRGEHIIVLDPAALLGIRPPEQGGRAVVLTCDGRRFALRIDSFSGLHVFRARETVEGADGSRRTLLVNREGAAIETILLSEIDRGILAKMLEPFSDFVVPAAAAAAEPLRAVLTFRVGDQRCGVALESVRRVMPWVEPLRAGESTGIAGAINVLGEVVPVLDVHRSLNLAEAGEERALVVVEVAGENWALQVEKVDGIQRVPDRKIIRLGSAGKIGGMIRSGDAYTWLLALDRSVDAAA